MISTAIILIFISAILHVSWNVMIQGADDPLIVATKALSFGMIILTPCVLIFWWLNGHQAISNEAWFYGLLTGIAELFYFMFLSYAYRHGELSIVYPIARGSAPIVSVILGLFLLHERVGAYQVAGIILLILGIWMVRQAKTKGGKGVVPALLMGVFIAAYTVIDKVGLRYADPVIFGWLKYFFTVLCLLAWVPIRRFFSIHKLTETEQATKKKTPAWKIALIGICIIATYQLVLFALSTTAVAIVSPLRESASVVVTAWGIWKLNEKEGLWLKVFGVLAIFVGIVMLAVLK